MTRVLPADTDFYTTTPRPYPGVILPREDDDAGRLLPRPTRLEITGGSIALRAPDDLPAATLPAVEAALGQRGGPVELRLIPRGDDTDSVLSRSGVPAPGDEDGYSIAPIADGRRLVVASRGRRGLRHGVETLRQLAASRGGAALTIARVQDSPATPIRFLGGWALWRADRLKEAIDLASTVKANRVLYNAWGWIPDDRLWKEDGFLAAYARERGVELVFELRRMSFGREFRLTEPACRRRLLDVYRAAAGAGFRSFGLLFDDVPWETAEDECALARDGLELLSAAVSGGSPELFVCPQFYWYPGQMDSAWKGRAGPEETARQRAYLETYGRRLPEGVHVYIANYWGDHPRDYQQALREEFTDLVGRRPVFFDNQVINDYRHGALFPFALHSRPADFGCHYAGYYLNSGRPLAAYAASAATALAYAWNPKDYRPEEAMGAALLLLFGPSGERTQRLASGLNLLRDIANEWADGVHTAVSHYATVWRQAREGRLKGSDVERWRTSLGAVREEWLGALRAAAAGASPLALEALLELVRSSHRLERDLDLFAEFCSGRGGPAFEETARAVAAEALAAVGAILPPAPNLAPLLERPGALAPMDSQAWSWVEYFHASTAKTLQNITAEMLEVISRGDASARSAGT